MISAAFMIALLAAQPHSAAEESFARRIFVLQADESCHLLSADERAALTASARQARSALEGAGFQTGSLEGRVRHSAKARSCDDELLQALADEARNAYAGWAALRSMDFPGQNRAWTARRVLEPDAMPRWAVWQRLDDGARFGLGVAQDEAVAMLAVPASGKQMRTLQSARLEMRDPDKLAQPLSTNLNGLIHIQETLGELPPYRVPQGSMKTVWASGYGPAKGEQAPIPDREYEIIYFPVSALTALARLEPTETVRIRIQRASAQSLHYIEVGDIAAAMAFIEASPPGA